jgi:hypothetical protein
MGRKGYPVEFRRRALDLVAAGRPITDSRARLGHQLAVDLSVAAAGPHR